MFVIVKYGDYINQFPRGFTVKLEDSCHNTYTGKEIGLPSSFSSREEGSKWLEKMRDLNPSVGYALCEVGKSFD